jgi:transcriptional regulator with XRE-family HTH domain
MTIPGADNPRGRFGAMLRAERRRAGLTQKQLATAIGSTQAYVSRTERGLENPPLLTCAAFAAAVSRLFEFYFRK